MREASHPTLPRVTLMIPEGSGGEGGHPAACPPHQSRWPPSPGPGVLRAFPRSAPRRLPSLCPGHPPLPPRAFSHEDAALAASDDFSAWKVFSLELFGIHMFSKY